MNSAHFIKAVLPAVLLSSIFLVQPLLADERHNGYRHDSRPNSYRQDDRHNNYRQDDRYNDYRQHEKDRVTLDHAVQKARSRYNGRVISAETVGAEEGSTHNIRILTNDGHVRRLRVDSTTGEYVMPRKR